MFLKKKMSTEYNYKIHCELIITSEKITPDEISKEIERKAYRSYKKGDKFISKRSGTEGKRATNLWAIKSNEIISEEENISPHINYFKKIITDKIGYLNKLKSDSANEIDFWVWIEADEAGIGLEIVSSELTFINSIANCLHITSLPHK